MTDSQDLPPTEALTRRALRDGANSSSARPRKPSSGGLRGLVAKHPTAWLASVLGVVFLLLATGAVFAGISAGSGGASAVTPTESNAPPRVQPSAIPAGSILRTCSVSSQAAAVPGLAASVVNVATGEVLFDRNGTTPASPGPVTKILTAAAAIQALGASTQLSTKVVLGSSPGTIVLVGGGDPTLSTTSNSFYEGAPLMDDLAVAAMTKYDELYPTTPVTQIVLDSTMWDPADNWESSWPTSLRSQGYLPFITALMVDGARSDPTQAVSSRSSDPIARAGEAFAAAAGLGGGVTFSRGSALGTTVLAEVKSQPISTLVAQMLEWDDDTLAEMLARVVAKTSGLNGGTSSAGQALAGTVGAFTIVPVPTLNIKDGSGESPLSTVAPQFIAQVLALAKTDGMGLGVVYSSLSEAGSGELSGRFTGANTVPDGAILAKAGTIDNQRSLAGVANSADGTSLAFAFYAIGDGSNATRDAVETLATAVYACGNNLSNN